MKIWNHGFQPRGKDIADRVMKLTTVMHLTKYYNSFFSIKIDQQRFGCQSQKTEKLTLATSLTPNATRPTVFWIGEYFWAWIIEAERLHKTTYVDFWFKPYFCRNRPSNFTIFFVRFAVNRRRTKWPVQKSLEEIKWWGGLPLVQQISSGFYPTTSRSILAPLLNRL